MGEGQAPVLVQDLLDATRTQTGSSTFQSTPVGCLPVVEATGTSGEGSLQIRDARTIFDGLAIT